MLNKKAYGGKKCKAKKNQRPKAAYMISAKAKKFRYKPFIT